MSSSGVSGDLRFEGFFGAFQGRVMGLRGYQGISGVIRRFTGMFQGYFGMSTDFIRF